MMVVVQWQNVRLWSVRREFDSRLPSLRIERVSDVSEQFASSNAI